MKPSVRRLGRATRRIGGMIGPAGRRKVSCPPRGVLRAVGRARRLNALNRWSDPCSQGSLTFIGASEAAASHNVVLPWAYNLAPIFLFGAEFT